MNELLPGMLVSVLVFILCDVIRRTLQLGRKCAYTHKNFRKLRNTVECMANVTLDANGDEELRMKLYEQAERFAQQDLEYTQDDIDGVEATP